LGKVHSTIIDREEDVSARLTRDKLGFAYFDVYEAPLGYTIDRVTHCDLVTTTETVGWNLSKKKAIDRAEGMQDDVAYQFRKNYTIQEADAARKTSRREFLAKTACAVSTFGGPLAIVEYLYKTSPEGLRTSIPKDETPINSPVRKYSNDIISNAYGLIPSTLLPPKEEDSVIGSIAGFATGLGLSYFPRTRETASAVFPMVGAGCLVSRLLDEYSTWRFAHTMQDSRFKEYGLNEAFGEANTSLPLHPSPDDILSKQNIIQEAGLVAFGALSLPVGMSFSAMGIPVFYNNMRVDRVMRVCMNMGDVVKIKLALGHSDEQIKGYLSRVKLDEIESIDLAKIWD